jgi:ribose transport system substrate-binding protein
MRNLSRIWALFATVLIAISAGPGIALAQGTPESASPAAISDTCLTKPIAEKDSYLIGMSQANKGEPWRQAMNDQIEAAAAAHPELDVVFADAAQDNAQQVADVEGFLQQGIDLLIISPNEAAPLTDVVARACAEGVPVIVLDRKVNGDQYTMWIGADNTIIGEQAGKYTATWCEEQGHDPCLIGEIRGLEGSTPAQERGDGFRTGIASNPSCEITASQNADWLREKAVPVSQAMFQANPDLNVLYAHNDPMAEAAIISAQNNGLDLESMLVIGIDGLPTPDGGLKSVIDGRIDVTYVYPTGGQQAIDWTMQILAGEHPPKEVVLDTIEVTKDNAQQVYEEFGGQ